jgi:uncharacterized protein (TIGR02099 family)
MWINRILWSLLVAALILAASYVSFGRYYIGYVENYQQDLVIRFEELSGLSVTVDRLYGTWSKLSPVLTMEGLTLYAQEGNKEPVLKIDDVSFQLDPIKSILKGAIQIQRLFIDGAIGSLEEASSGRWQLKGYDRPADSHSDVNNIIDLVLSVEDAQLLDVQLKLFYIQGSNVGVTIKELSLKQADDFRRVQLEILINQSKKPLTAIVEAKGDPREGHDFSAKAYLKLDSVDFSARLPDMAALGFELDDALVDGELWLNWQPHTLIDIQGALSIPLLDIEALSGKPLAPLTKLQMSFRAEKTIDHNWHAWVPEFSTIWQDQLLTLTDLGISLNSKQLNVSLLSLDLDRTTEQLLAIDLLSQSLLEKVEILSPSGHLQNVNISLSRDLGDQSVPRFTLRANLDAVGISPWEAAPGSTGLSGYIELDPLSGLVEIDSDNFLIDFPLIYHRPLSFTSARGQLEWRITDDRVLVDSSPLYLIAEHGPATALLDLDLPLEMDAIIPPKMTLAVGLIDTDITHRDKYIPYTLNPEFLEWMAGSLPKGHVIDGGFIYRGSLLKDDDKNRTVQLYFNVNNTTLAFHPDWPMLTDIAGLVEIDNEQVSVVTSQAKMFSLDFLAADVSVIPIKDGGLWLTVAISGEGDAKDALRIVNESALNEMVSGVFDRWQLSGDASATVVLGLPLSGATKDPEIDVTVAIADADLLIPEYRLKFSELNGPLIYQSDKGIYSTGLHANLYDKAFVIDVKQIENKSVLVDINGRVDLSNVKAWSGLAALAFTTGETDFAAQIKVSPHDGGEFTVKSDLAGVIIDLPAPYKKSAKEERAFWLTLPLVKDESLLRMGLEDNVELQLNLNRGIAESGLLLLGKSESMLHEKDFMVISGAVDYLDYDQWQPVLQRYLAASESMLAAKQLTDSPQSGGQVPEDETGLSVKVRDLIVHDFSGFNQRHLHSKVNLQRWQEAWLLSVANESILGELFVPDEISVNSPLIVKLERFVLPKMSVEKGISSIGLDSIGPVNLDADIQNLFIGEESYGNLAFDLRSDEKGLRFENISGLLRGVTFEKDKPTTLEWFHGESGETSRLYGGFTFSDISDVLDQWGYERIIESQSGAVSIDLSWQGKPYEWELAASQGPIYLKVKDGRFLKTSDTASGTLKVVGIVNFTNIARRLQFDFSDIYESGISYDRIEGEVVLEKSQLKIVEDLIVKTPSSRFYLRGNANLLGKELDMELIATLPVVNNLPWIAALAGGLPTAAGVYVASKIFEDQVDRFSSAVYTIEGDWNDPEMNFKRVFD